MNSHCLAVFTSAVTTVAVVQADSLELAGVTSTPHLQSKELRYRREPDFSLGARVQLFVRNAGNEDWVLKPDAAIRLRDKSPDELLAADEWTWHDFPSAWTDAPLVLPPGALTVWSFNGKRAPWGAGTEATFDIDGRKLGFDIAEPCAWLSAVTFLGHPTNPFPESLIFHVANHTGSDQQLEACRLWLPKDNRSWRTLLPQPWLKDLKTFSAGARIPAGDRGGASLFTGRLPLTYTALEVRLADAAGKVSTLWAHLRIKREAFDISGGWVSGNLGGRNSLTFEPYLKTLRRMHINTGHIGPVGGYTDNPELYARYPLKYFNRLTPFYQLDREDVLPRIHAVEFLGEPQYGGGRPVPPQEVWQKLAPYQPTRLTTTVTHSEERIWRYYAGLSDYPHYDAYRVNAPSPDAWTKYDRWGGQTLRWGAPLETIGDMTRSLRELNRPRAIAYWSQGAHAGWDSYGGRQRTSPTPDELRQQAYYALASRITSLYWFNLSLKSLVKFPDLIEPIARVGREIRILEHFYLEGDATSHERVLRDGKPDWDLDVVAGPRGALLFALDLDYQPDPDEKVFKFGPPREVTFRFRLPTYARRPAEVFRLDANSVTTIKYRADGEKLEIQDRVSRTAIYVATRHPGEGERIEQQRKALIAEEDSFRFDPGRNAADLEVLKQLLEAARK